MYVLNIYRKVSLAYLIQRMLDLFMFKNYFLSYLLKLVL